MDSSNDNQRTVDQDQQSGVSRQKQTSEVKESQQPSTGSKNSNNEMSNGQRKMSEEHLASRLPVKQSTISRPIIKPTKSKTYIKDPERPSLSSSPSFQKSTVVQKSSMSSPDRVLAVNHSKSDVFRSQGNEEQASNSNAPSQTIKKPPEPQETPEKADETRPNVISKDVSLSLQQDLQHNKSDKDKEAKPKQTSTITKETRNKAPAQPEKKVKVSQTVLYDGGKPAIVRKNDVNTNNRIVVETETVDSSPIVSLALYDKGINGGKHDEKFKKLYDLPTSNTNLAATANNGVAGVKNDVPDKVNEQPVSKTNSTDNIVGDMKSNDKKTNNDKNPIEQDIKKEEMRTPSYEHEVTTSRVPSIFEKPKDNPIAMADGTNTPEAIDNHDDADEKSSINKGGLNQGIPHAAYSRSLRNKRSILIDTASLSNSNSSNLLSNANNAPNNPSASNLLGNIPSNLVTSTTSIGNNPNGAPQAQDDDTRSITSSIKKPKPKPRLKKITSSRADIFEAQVEDALYDDQNSDGNETFVYESRGHSRDNSTNTIELDAENETNPEPRKEEKANQIEVTNADTRRNPPLPLQGLINDQMENFKMEKSSLRGVPRNSSGQSYTDQQDRGAKYTKQGKAYKKTKLANTDDSDLNPEDQRHEEAFVSGKDFDLDSNSAVMSEHHPYTHHPYTPKYKKPRVKNDRVLYDPYNYNLSSSHDNTSDSELEYTTDDFTYPRFTRYKRASLKYNGAPIDTHVLNNVASIAGSNSSAVTSINNPVHNISSGSSKGHRYLSRNSSVSNMEKKKANGVQDNEYGGMHTPTYKRSSSRSPIVNYLPQNYRRYSQRLKSKLPYDDSPTKNIQTSNNGSVKTNHHYSKPPLPNQLRTTISKLFDPQGTNLKRYSGVPDDFNVDDIEDENYDDDVNYFGYDLEDGSEINESTPLNFDYYNSYSRNPKLRNMNSLEDAKMNAYRHSRMRSNSNFKDNALMPNGRPYHRKAHKSTFPLIQSTFWGILLMISFLALGFVCGFFLASTKDLADVDITEIKHILVSVDELIFDIQCNGVNPGFTSIVVDQVDLDLFVKTRYLDNGDDYDGLFNYETFFIGNIKKLEYPLVFPSNLIDKKKMEATSSIRLIDPGKNASDPTYNDDIIRGVTSEKGTETLTLTEHRHPSLTVAPVHELESKETTRQKNWKVSIKHPFELIVRGKFNYKLPLASSFRTIAVHKSVSVDPAKSSNT